MLRNIHGSEARPSLVREKQPLAAQSVLPRATEGRQGVGLASPRGAQSIGKAEPNWETSGPLQRGAAHADPRLPTESLLGTQHPHAGGGALTAELLPTALPKSCSCALDAGSGSHREFKLYCHTDFPASSGPAPCLGEAGLAAGSLPARARRAGVRWGGRP